MKKLVYSTTLNRVVEFRGNIKFHEGTTHNRVVPSFTRADATALLTGIEFPVAIYSHAESSDYFNWSQWSYSLTPMNCNDCYVVVGSLEEALETFSEDRDYLYFQGAETDYTMAVKGNLYDPYSGRKLGAVDFLEESTSPEFPVTVSYRGDIDLQEVYELIKKA